MAAAWLLCATLGMFIARYLKAGWPGKKVTGLFSFNHLFLSLIFIIIITPFILIMNFIWSILLVMIYIQYYYEKYLFINY